MCNIHKYLYWKMKGLLHNILKLKKKNVYQQVSCESIYI